MTAPEERKDSGLFEAIAKAKGRHAAKPFEVRLPFTEAEAERERNPIPGQVMRDGSIYVGQIKYTMLPATSPDDSLAATLKNLSKPGVSKTFNIFAAPEDLPDGPVINTRAVSALVLLRNWHGYDGTYLPFEERIKKALGDGSYNGGWVIPPQKALEQVIRHVPNLQHSVYMSSTQETQMENAVMTTARQKGSLDRTAHPCGCRPVRFVPAP